MADRGGDAVEARRALVEGAGVPVAETLAPRALGRRGREVRISEELLDQLFVDGSLGREFSIAIVGPPAVHHPGDRIDDGGTRATSNPRVAIFVDVPNLIYATERRKVALDFSVSQREQPQPVGRSGMDPLAVVGISAMEVGAAGLIVWGGTGIAAMVRAGDLGCEDALCPTGKEDVAELARRS